MSSLKEKVHAALCENIAEKITRLNNNLADLRSSAANETKSTAGDKYETALAMLQAEQDRVKKQLQELMMMQAVAVNLPVSFSKNIVEPGSIVETDSAIFYISVAAGKINVDAKTIISISEQSPLGKKLFGKKKNDKIEMNGTTYLIKEIC